MKTPYIIIAVLLAAVFVLSKGKSGYKSISANQAKEMMDGGEVTVLDVREQDEYNAGHIRNAVLLPVGTINAETAAAIKEKNSTVLVYCRSGNRSRKAAAALAKLGYTEVYDFGGIIDWPYGVE